MRIRVRPGPREERLCIVGQFRHGHGQTECLVHQGPPLRRPLTVAKLPTGVLEEALCDGVVEVCVQEAFERVHTDLIPRTRTLAVISAIL